MCDWVERSQGEGAMVDGENSYNSGGDKRACGKRQGRLFVYCTLSDSIS